MPRVNRPVAATPPQNIAPQPKYQVGGLYSLPHPLPTPPKGTIWALKGVDQRDSQKVLAVLQKDTTPATPPIALGSERIVKTESALPTAPPGRMWVQTGNVFGASPLYPTGEKYQLMKDPAAVGFSPAHISKLLNKTPSKLGDAVLVRRGQSLPTLPEALRGQSLAWTERAGAPAGYALYVLRFMTWE